MAGEFEQLLPFTWRDLHLPISRITVSLAHDLVEHKYWGVDGARVESTGAAPIRVSAVIPIANSIFPGKNERWAAGGLYPDALRKFMLAFADRTTGFLQHPEFGLMTCKPERMSFELAGEKQDCTEIQASWVETIDDEVRGFDVDTPIQEIELGASDLNASGVDLRALAPGLPAFEMDLIDLIGKLASLPGDMLSVLSYRSVGLFNRILYQASRLENSIHRAMTGQLAQPTSLRPFNSRPKQPALTWPAIQALQRIKAGAFEGRKRALSPAGIGLYLVPADTTLAGVALSLPRGTSMADVIKLNPSLARSPVVSKGTIVRYLIPK